MNAITQYFVNINKISSENIRHYKIQIFKEDFKAESSPNYCNIIDMSIRINYACRKIIVSRLNRIMKSL